MDRLKPFSHIQSNLNKLQVNLKCKDWNEAFLKLGEPFELEKVTRSTLQAQKEEEEIGI